MVAEGSNKCRKYGAGLAAKVVKEAVSETRTGDQQCLKATETIDVVFQSSKSVALDVE